MSLEKRIEALESEIKAIRGTGKGWSLNKEANLYANDGFFSGTINASDKPPVMKHLEALVALVGPDFKVENSQVFIKNTFIEEEPTQNAKYDLTLNITHGEEKAAQNQTAKSTVTFNVENFAFYVAKP